MSAANAFLEVAERQIASPVRARERAADKRAERQERERAELKHVRERLHREDLAIALASPHGAALKVLIAFLENMTLKSAGDLVAHVEAGRWREVDPDTRFLVLQLVDNAIVELREQHGLPPFDDALPDEPPTAFEIIRSMLS